MEIVLIVAVCFISLWIWSLVVNAKAKTPVGRIQNMKKSSQFMLRKEWRHTRELGSTEDIGDWMKRKLPMIDDDWLRKNRGLDDEQLIECGVNYWFSHPRVIEHLLKTDREDRLSEAEEQSFE